MNPVFQFFGVTFISLMKLIFRATAALFPGLIKSQIIHQLKLIGVEVIDVKPSSSSSGSSDLIQDLKLEVENSGQNSENTIKIRVKSPRVYQSLGRMSQADFLNDYVDGWWDGENPEHFDHFLIQTLKARLNEVSCGAVMENIEFSLFSSQNTKENWRGCRKLYDFGNDHFAAILGPTMKYSCAYWQNATDLDAAEEASMDLIGRKLNLQEGMRLLYIGCGWGTVAKYLADHFKVNVVAISNSREGVEYARKYCSGSRVAVQLADYRDLYIRKDGQNQNLRKTETENENDIDSDLDFDPALWTTPFDRLLCIEMIEHIGPKNYDSFFDVAASCLADNGLMLLQVNTRDREESLGFSPWIHQAFSPNAFIPHPREILKSTNARLIVEDVHVLGLDYARTLGEWRENLKRNWPNIAHLYRECDEPEGGEIQGDKKKKKGGCQREEGENTREEKVFRLWYLFLSLSRASYLVRDLQLYQLVLSKPGSPQRYSSVR